MLYIRFPLSLRNVEDLLHERGMDVSHETICYWWNRFGPMFAPEIRKKRVQQLRAMQRFRRMRSLQKFASVHSSVYNHFNKERSLTSRGTFKLPRTAALTE
nr:IS6 family transposase [Ruegeria profundi]